MLVECLAAPDEGRYVEQVIVRLVGSVDVTTVTRAWQLLVDRYPALRTTLHWRDLERPLQAVHRRATVGVRASDLARLDARARERALNRFLLDDRAKGFELSQAPLVRVTVLRTAAEEHFVVVTLHHIVLDGWSLSIVMAEFSRLYAAGARVAGAELEPVPPYSSFIAWLREASPARSEEYWRGELAGYHGAPTLADGSPPGRPGEIRRAVPPDVVRQDARPRPSRPYHAEHGGPRILGPDPRSHTRCRRRGRRHRRLRAQRADRRRRADGRTADQHRAVASERRPRRDGGRLDGSASSPRGTRPRVPALRIDRGARLERRTQGNADVRVDTRVREPRGPRTRPGRNLGACPRTNGGATHRDRPPRRRSRAHRAVRRSDGRRPAGERDRRSLPAHSRRGHPRLVAHHRRGGRPIRRGARSSWWVGVGGGG